MAIRGRKPTPTAIKMLEGNPGKRPMNGSEPKPLKKAPSCPKWLELEAKREWRRLAKQMESIGILTDVDMAAFAGYCQAYARWKEAEEKAIDAEKKAAEHLSGAKASEKAAKDSEKSASASKAEAEKSKNVAAQSEKNAKASADQAKVSEENAFSSESNADRSEQNAKSSESAAKTAQNQAESYAIGGTGTRSGEDTDNSKYYAEQARNAAEESKGNDVLAVSGKVLIIHNSAAASVQDLTVYGETKQITYKGYNLCGGEYQRARYWAQTDALLLKELNELQTGTYRLWTEGKITSIDENYDQQKSGNLVCGAAIYIGDKEFTSNQTAYDSNTVGSLLTKSRVFTITEDLQGTFTHFYLYSCGTGKDGIHGSGNLKVMITAGSDEKAYEPYVGGMPSPNINYPQSVQVIKDPSIYIYGRNLLQIQTMDTVRNGVTVKTQEDGSIKMAGTATDGFGFYFQNLVIPTGDYRIRLSSQGTIENAWNIELHIYKKGGVSMVKVVWPDTREGAFHYDAEDPSESVYLWVPKGSKLNTVLSVDVVPVYFSEEEYVSCDETTYAEPLIGKDGKSYELCSLELNKNTTLRDELHIFPDGSRKLIKKIVHEQFTRNSGWRMVLNKPDKGIYLFGAYIHNSVQYEGVGQCSHAIFQLSTSAGNGKFYVEENNFYLFSDQDTLEGFLNIIGDKTIDLYYNLLTPKEIDLTDGPVVKTKHQDTTLWTKPLLSLDLSYAALTAEGAMERTDQLVSKLQRLTAREDLLSVIVSSGENINISDASKFHRRWNGKGYDYYLYLQINDVTIDAGKQSLITIPEEYCSENIYGVEILNDQLLLIKIDTDSHTVFAVIPEAIENGTLSVSLAWSKEGV